MPEVREERERRHTGALQVRIRTNHNVSKHVDVAVTRSRACTVAVHERRAFEARLVCPRKPHAAPGSAAETDRGGR